MSFKLTYATMFDPPPELHTRFEAALAEVRQTLGADHSHFVNGVDLPGSARADKHSPIDRNWLLGRFATAGASEVEAAVAAARAAWPAWRALPWPARKALLLKVADLIDERVYAISAAVALEVGKNRMEALGEVQETAEFFRIYCAEFERNSGFDHTLPDDPLPGFSSHNRSVARPYGVWAVITPFNFPFALMGGPAAAALVTGNTVVAKGAPETPWSGRLLAECLRDAGLPPGVFNYLNDPLDEAGPLLAAHSGVQGLTFTGSHAVGMSLCRQFAAGAYPRPLIAEMGGKNACIVTAKADLDRATLGILRSAYGLSGQKCSALSRIYVEAPVADALISKLQAAIASIRVGDPTLKENWLGPVAHAEACANYERYAADLHAGATVLAGAVRLTGPGCERGFFCAPTLAEAPLEHPLWREEMFVPIAMLARVPDPETGLQLANDSPLGLTAGFYGSAAETAWFFEHIEAGVTYANRPQGATTGAWPGYQPFGGWKGSGNTGKGIASFYYLAQYLREQSQTEVEA